MPSNQTPNYGLSQWSKSDRIQMEDFNADNAKIDAALAAQASTLSAHTAQLAKLGNCQVWTTYKGLLTYVPIPVVDGKGTTQTYTVQWYMNAVVGGVVNHGHLDRDALPGKAVQQLFNRLLGGGAGPVRSQGVGYWR